MRCAGRLAGPTRRAAPHGDPGAAVIDDSVGVGTVGDDASFRSAACLPRTLQGRRQQVLGGHPSAPGGAVNQEVDPSSAPAAGTPLRSPRDRVVIARRLEELTMSADENVATIKAIYEAFGDR